MAPTGRMATASLATAPTSANVISARYFIDPFS
jgi:hypothetical protein